MMLQEQIYNDMQLTCVPTASVLKFLTVLGTVFPNNPMTIRPVFSPPISISKNTYNRAHVYWLYTLANQLWHTKLETCKTLTNFLYNTQDATIAVSIKYTLTIRSPTAVTDNPNLIPTIQATNINLFNTTVTTI